MAVYESTSPRPGCLLSPVSCLLISSSSLVHPCRSVVDVRIRLHWAAANGTGPMAGPLRLRRKAIRERQRVQKGRK
jgi:hypothetical protein